MGIPKLDKSGHGEDGEKSKPKGEKPKGKDEE
jgi:hypothetical protein